ncbi:hypothetical protein KK116_18155 [Enterobacter dykesii]|uniref:hypothetical protein n=1 Tax=Enterobacter TaxID=547 RepID=UPI00190F35A2|nr:MULTISPECIES: hypothetical protein [Enterobacter]MBT1716173.1 hypothetical protein [Enterobacter dykesii]MCR6470631.1 hypothetical protein [Enterobacter sp. HG048]
MLEKMDRRPQGQSYRAKKSKGGGQSPQFKMCIDPVLKLKEQLDAMAAEEGIF